MNNSIKRFIGYLIYVVAFGYVVLKADNLQRYWDDLISTTYDPIYAWLSALFASIFPILVGVLLALPQFIRTYKQEGSWKIDWIMLLTIGLPAFFVTITPIFYVTGFTFKANLIYFVSVFHPTLFTVAGIVLGFVLITSFGKGKAE